MGTIVEEWEDKGDFSLGKTREEAGLAKIV